MGEGENHTAWHCCRDFIYEQQKKIEFQAATSTNYHIDPDYHAFLIAGTEENIMAMFAGYPSSNPPVVIQVKKGMKRGHPVKGSEIFHFAPEVELEGPAVFYEIDTGRWDAFQSGMRRRRNFHTKCSKCDIEHTFVVWVEWIPAYPNMTAPLSDRDFGSNLGSMRPKLDDSE